MRPEGLAWLADALETRAGELALVKLAGSTSATLYRVESGGRRAVLRVLDNAAWLADEPDLAEHEAAALDLAHASGLPAPKTIAFSPTDIGFGAPVVLMTFVDGEIQITPTDTRTWIDEMARTLAQIHAVDAPNFPWRYESWLNRENLTPPSWATDSGLWRAAIEIVLAPPPKAVAPLVFLHRDFHPMNLLWQNDRVSGIVDWINACVGNRSADVAYARTDLAMLEGVDAADQFLATYQTLVPGFELDPYFECEKLVEQGCSDPDGPGFYDPWLVFGREHIPVERRRAVVEERLRRALHNT